MAQLSDDQVAAIMEDYLDLAATHGPRASPLCQFLEQVEVLTKINKIDKEEGLFLIRHAFLMVERDVQLFEAARKVALEHVKAFYATSALRKEP